MIGLASSCPKYAHRVAFWNERGSFPAELKILHTCDNPSCCNPAHLFTGTDQDNAKDRNKKCRQARGQRIGEAKLTELNVLEIRRLLKQNFPHRKIAATFGVTHTTVGRIKRKEKWAWL